MSYILDALRRAQRDRHRDDGSPVDAVANNAPMPVVERARWPQRLLITVAILILLLLIANLVWMLMPRRSIPAETSESSAAASSTSSKSVAPARESSHNKNAGGLHAEAARKAARATGTTPRLIPAGNATSGAPNPITNATAIHSMSQLTASATRQKPPGKHVNSHLPKRPSTPGAASKSAPEVPSNKNAAHQPKSDQPAHAPPDKNVPTQGSGITTHPLASAGKTKGKSTAPPPAVRPGTDDLKMMSDNYRANFPQITVQVHVYNPDPDKCWIMIDGNRYRAGQTLSDGLKIEKIVPQGIVFKWHGKEVLFPT